MLCGRGIVAVGRGMVWVGSSGGFGFGFGFGVRVRHGVCRVGGGIVIGIGIGIAIAIAIDVDIGTVAGFAACARLRRICARNGVVVVGCCVVRQVWVRRVAEIVVRAAVRVGLCRVIGGKAAGVRYIDKKLGEHREATGRVIVLAASTGETARILLNSKPNGRSEGLANSSGQVGRNLMDTVGSNMSAYFPQLEGRPRYNEDGAMGLHAYIPFWQYKEIAEGKFDTPRGYHVEIGGSFGEPVYSIGHGQVTFAHPYGWGIDQGDWSVSASWFDRELTRNEAEGQGVAARGTWAPVRADGRLLHLGLSASRRDAPDDGIRLRARPNMDLADIRLLDTGAMPDARRATTVGAEAMWIQGPVKVQAEWFESTVDRRSADDFDASGGYASVVWQPGGQSWGYAEGVPRTPGAGDGRGGLWQLGIRYDRLDLDDPGAGIAGGTMDVWTAGVNWYYGENLKLALNYVDADTHRDAGAPLGWLAIDPASVQARVQLAW